MRNLTILYDDTCELCRRLRLWLGVQPAYVTLFFTPLRSPELPARFPDFGALDPAERLVVIADTGDYWRGDAAWITVLWALREYREWALRLAHPVLRPLARKACALVSQNRHGISKWLAGASVPEIRERLESQPEPRCATGRANGKEGELCHRR